MECIRPDLAVSGVSSTGADAVVAAAQNRPDVVLMDFRLPDVTGPAAARTIKNAHADAAILFHTADDSERALLDAIDAGAIAYLTKEADQIIEAVPRVRCRGPGCAPSLSPTRRGNIAPGLPFPLTLVNCNCKAKAEGWLT